jgi:hypothetical protein
MSDNRTPTDNLNDYWNITAYANFKYCQLHDYDFIYYKPFIKDKTDNSLLCCRNPTYPISSNKRRHISWTKILTTHHTLKKYKRAIYLDSDAIFNNYNNIDSILSAYDTQNKQVIFLSDHPYHAEAPCAGFFICNYSAEAFKFLRSWYCDQHHDPIYDQTHPWEQNSIHTWGFINLKLSPYYVTLPANQFKWSNFKHSGFFKNMPESTDSHYLTGNRPIIDHYVTKRVNEIVENVKELYDMSDFQETIKIINDKVVYLDTDNYQF